jgi:hypothetical protein
MSPHLAFRTRRRIVVAADFASDLAVAISAFLLVIGLVAVSL